MANYKLNEAKMFADITDGVAIIINSETGIYFGANSLGTAVIENLFNGVSTDSVSAAIEALPGAPADMKAKVEAFSEELLRKGLVVVADASDGEAKIDAAAVADGFDLKINEFSDAQELLLADPIHEVKEDTGWTPEVSSINSDKDDVARREAKMES